MSGNKKLRRKDVKREVKRIQKLPEYERDRQMKAIYKSVVDEIESTSARVNIYNRFWEKRKEVWRLLYCVMVFPKNYRKSIYKIWDKAFTNNVNNAPANKVEHIVKTKTAHVSGLPLPEQAEVYVWWQGDKLIFASAATEFSLPAERVMGMGTTRYSTGGTYASYWTYLTIEYKKEDGMKYIVVRVKWEQEVTPLINYFEEKKGTREMNKQQL